jgi:drug/metabolite transporter (DMT)-like permease
MIPIPRFSRLDLLLLLMAVIWGTNYVVVKTAFHELDPQAFNAVRLLVASGAFLLVMGALKLRRDARADAGPTAAGTPPALAGIFYTPARVQPREWLALALLGLVGHVGYQYLFIGGLARTSVANSSLILAASPVVIALFAGLAGQERVGLAHWGGAAVSALGIYLVVGRGFRFSGEGLVGDLMTFGAVCCWAIYSLGARPLMTRHSPVGVTGLSMAFGTAMYVPMMWPRVAATDWTTVSGWTLGLLVYSALFALCIAYTIWYLAVRQIGSARTAVYSNLVPIVALAAAALFIAEPVDRWKVLGAAAVLAGVALTRVGATRPATPGSGLRRRP